MTTNGAVQSTTASQQSQSTASAAGQAAATASKTLGEADFLTLLTAQLQNQDPTQPMDNTAFVSELAQFSSLQQMQDVSSQLGTLAQAMTTSTNLSANSLVGSTVTYTASGVNVVQGTPPSLQVNLPSAATVTAVIADSNGNTVRTLNAGALPAGLTSLGWDGTDSSGNNVASGYYTVKLSATAANGTQVSATAQTSGLVQGVSLAGGTAQLMIGGGLVGMSSILQVTNSSN